MDENNKQESSERGHSEPESPEFDFDYLKETATQILTKPEEAWENLKSSPESIKSMYLRYGVFLLAVPALRNFIEHASKSLFGSFVYAIIMYAVSLGMLYVFAFIFEILAVKFSGKCSRPQGFKLALYSATPQFVAPLVDLLPGGIFTAISFLISLYGFYLLYTGIPILSTVPKQKRLTFLIASVVVVGICIVLISAIFMPLMPAEPVITSYPYRTLIN